MTCIQTSLKLICNEYVISGPKSLTGSTQNFSISTDEDVATTPSHRQNIVHHRPSFSFSAAWTRMCYITCTRNFCKTKCLYFTKFHNPYYLPRNADRHSDDNFGARGSKGAHRRAPIPNSCLRHHCIAVQGFCVCFLPRTPQPSRWAQLQTKWPPDFPSAKDGGRVSALCHLRVALVVVGYKCDANCICITFQIVTGPCR